MIENTITNQKLKKNLWLLIVLIVLLIIWLAYKFMGNNSEVSQENVIPINQEINTDDIVKNSENQIKSFAIDAKNFSFEPSEIKVQQGDTIEITLNNIEGFHDLIIDAFNINTGRLAVEQTKTISFTADKAGTFEYYCSVGNHRQMGMRGNLIVE